MHMPTVGELLISNGGDGPGLARVVGVESDKVRLERWQGTRRQSSIICELPLRFVLSESCGWVPLDAKDS